MYSYVFVAATFKVVSSGQKKDKDVGSGFLWCVANCPPVSMASCYK
jgi:hypothetical protein